MSRRPALAPIPWRALTAWVLVGLLASVGGVLYNLSATESELGGLVDTRAESTAAPLIDAELGPNAMKPGGYHDGAFFYAIARDPWHPDRVAAHLDGPRYRLQRILYPTMAWALHPTGGGQGLVWALFAVGIVSLAIGAYALGALSVTLGGRPWPAVLFPLLFGSVVSLRISVSDPTALACALLALALYFRGMLPAAILAATASVLAKEPTLLIFAGLLLWRRDRATLALFAVPAAAGGLWALYLLVAIPTGGEHTPAFAPPFTGLVESFRFWAKGYEPVGLMNLLTGVGIGLYALVKRGFRHPLAWIVAVQLAFLTVLTAAVLAPERNSSRQVMALVALGALMLATPDARRLVGREASGDGQTPRSAAAREPAHHLRRRTAGDAGRDPVSE